MLFFFFICGLFEVGCQTSHENEIQSPISSNDIDEMTYEEIASKYQNAGFTNVRTEAIDNIIIGLLTKDGEIESVSVNEKTSFSTDTWFPKDATIVIKYHTYPNKNEENNTLATTTQKPEEVDSDELASIIKLSSPNDELIKTFAKNNTGKIITFDGYIAYITAHENFKTRYDILMYAGDWKSGMGPNFEFVDVSAYDLNSEDLYIQSFIEVGAEVKITAKIVRYDDNSEMFILDPISLEPR